MNLFTYLKAFITVRKEISVQKKFNRHFLLPYMKELENKHGGTFPAPQVKKILKYYGLFIPCILCASYKRLHEKTLTVEERERASLFGILTPVGDDLFDIDNLDVESIKEITFSPETYTANTFSAKVAKEIQTYLINHVPAKEAYIEASKNVFEIQLQTMRQTNAQITNAEIETITYAKGGYSVIIYHQVLDEIASPEMQDALFKIGALMQFSNDCFDIYKDIHDGIFTLASRSDDYITIKILFLEKVKEANKLVMALPFSTKRKDEFLVIMHAIISQGLVAIDQMIRLQKKLGKPIDCLQQPRKELVTDMQKLPNVVRWIYYAYKLPGM